MQTPRITRADQIDKDRLGRFLQGAYGTSKSRFLQNHGAWWHRGHQNRLILWLDDKIAAYCGLIPTTCLLEGKPEPALWWMDLIVAPEFRGRGLMSHVYGRLETMDVLKMGFPNELAAKIHRRHQWGVREDLQVLLLPLRPLDVKMTRRSSGVNGWFLKAGAGALSPLATLFSQRLKSYSPVHSRRLTEPPSAQVLASIFDRYQPGDVMTTHRDEGYFRWRFLKAPYALDYYLAGPTGSETHYLIARTVEDEGVTVTRILDFFGDFTDVAALRDILKLALKDAVGAGSSQVTVMATLPELEAELRSVGFRIRTKARFCWRGHTGGQELDRRVYWTLADSDNDAILK